MPKPRNRRNLDQPQPTNQQPESRKDVLVTDTASTPPVVPSQSDDLQDLTNGNSQPNTLSGEETRQDSGLERLADDSSTGTVQEDKPSGEEARQDGGDQSSNLEKIVSQERMAEAVVTETAPPPISASSDVADKAEVVTGDKYDEYLAEVASNGTRLQKSILAALDTFTKNFAPRQIYDAGVAFKVQWGLLSAMTAVLESDYDDFRPAWNALLIYFHKNADSTSRHDYKALSVYNTDRYLDQWKRGEESRAAYSQLLVLARNTSNPDTRRMEAKNIVLDRIGRRYLSAKATTNLITFYQ